MAAIGQDLPIASVCFQALDMLTRTAPATKQHVAAKAVITAKKPFRVSPFRAREC